MDSLPLSVSQSQAPGVTLRDLIGVESADERYVALRRGRSVGFVCFAIAPLTSAGPTGGVVWSREQARVSGHLGATASIDS